MEATTPLTYIDAVRRGLTQRELSGDEFDHPAQGLYAPIGLTNDLDERCAALLLVLPADAMFTHVTAARLRGWWVPDQLGDSPIIACTDEGKPHHNRRGVYVRRCRTPAEQRSSLRGLPVAKAERVLSELAEDLSLLDLVCVVDSALRARSCTRASIQAVAAARLRGGRRLSAAAALADGLSESRWETVLRLLHVWSRLPVVPQHTVRDSNGGFLAVADLRILGTNRLPEYDGADHREAQQHVKDLAREKVLARDGWERYGDAAVEICHRPDRIVEDGYAALGRTPPATATDRWVKEFRLSSLSASGRARLAGRMQRFERDRSPRRRPAT